MKRLFLTVLAILFLTGTTTIYKAEESSIAFGDPLLTKCVSDGRGNIGLLIRSPEEIQKMWDEQNPDNPKKVYAFSFYAPKIDSFILVVPPLRGQADRFRFNVWGHELAHGFCGAFHP